MAISDVLISRDPFIWAQLVVYSTALAWVTIATMTFHTDSDSQNNLKAALVACLVTYSSWVVLPRIEYRHRILSKLCGGNRRLAQYLFVVYILTSSFAWREPLVAKAIDSEHISQAFFTSLHWATSAIDVEIIKWLGHFLFAAGMVLNLGGFYHVRLNTYYPEYFGFIQGNLVTAFPYNVTSHPMYIGAVVSHIGYALQKQSSTALYLAAVEALGYWTVAKVFEEPFMEVFYPDNTKDSNK